MLRKISELNFWPFLAPLAAGVVLSASSLSSQQQRLDLSSEASKSSVNELIEAELNIQSGRLSVIFPGEMPGFVDELKLVLRLEQEQRQGRRREVMLKLEWGQEVAQELQQLQGGTLEEVLETRPKFSWERAPWFLGGMTSPLFLTFNAEWELLRGRKLEQVLKVILELEGVRSLELVTIAPTARLLERTDWTPQVIELALENTQIQQSLQSQITFLQILVLTFTLATIAVYLKEKVIFGELPKINPSSGSTFGLLTAKQREEGLGDIKEITSQMKREEVMNWRIQLFVRKEVFILYLGAIQSTLKATLQKFI